MGEQGHRLSNWQRIVLFSVGAFVGAFLISLYIRYRFQQRTRPGATAPVAPPQGPKAIVLRPPQEAKAVQAAHTPIRIRAVPPAFRQGEMAAIEVETAPGAVCTIEGRYSTHRSPSSLSSEPRTADASGTVRWSWRVGTNGMFVDIVVEARHEGHVEESARLRVPVAK